MSWLRFGSRKDKGHERPSDPPVTLEVLSSALQKGLRAVAAANERYSRARGGDIVVAWRELHAVLQQSVDSLNGTLGDEPSPRLLRMVRLTVAELWETTEPRLFAHTPTTAEDVALVRQTLWLRVEMVHTAHAEAGDRSTWQRLAGLPDEVDAAVGAMAGAAADQEAGGLRAVADEIRTFVGDRIGRGQQV